jgi:hypothetical protein
MAGVKYNSFAGETPRLSSRLLPQNGAQLAENCKLTSGELAPWAGPETVSALAKWTQGDEVKSVYRLDYNGSDYWLHWVESELNTGEVVKVFPSPTIGDTHGRLYFNKGGELYVTTGALATTGVSQEYPIDSYKLGITPPSDTPTVTEGTIGTLNDVTITYVYTFVSIYGEESAPSLAGSATGKPVTGSNSWSIVMAATPSNGDYPTYQYRNIYRTFTAGDGSTDYYLVEQINAATTNYTDITTDANLVLNETLPSTEWNNPPTDIVAYTYMGNGVFAVISGNSLYFSEPFQPHAFPSAYRRNIGFEGIALEAIGNSLIVLTNGDPVVLSGTDPSFMSDAKLDTNQPCVSAATVVNLGSAVAYMSPVGYVFAGLGGSDVITRSLFAKSDWSDTNPSTASFATRYDDGLMWFTPSNAYLLTPSEQLSLLTSINLTTISTLYTDSENGMVFYVRNGTLYKWDSFTTKIAYRWRSRVEVFPEFLNLGAVKIISDAGQDSPGNTVDVPYMTTDPILEFRLYAHNETTDDFDLKHTQTVTSQSVFRTPSGFKSKEYYIELEGTATVREVRMAETVSQLKGM